MSETDIILRTKTKNSRKILFGAPRLGTSILLGIEGWALLTLYTTGYGMLPILAGVSISIGYLTIACSQFLLGLLSDSKFTRWGRRKPYIVIFAPFLGISIIFLLLPGLIIDINDKNALFLWMVIWEIIFRFSYGVTTPYQAWMAEEFPIEERPKVSQFQNTFNYLGSGIMAIFSIIILTSYVNELKLAREAPIPFIPPIPLKVSLPIISFGIMTIVLFFIIALKMPTEPHFKIESSLKDSLKTILKNKNFMHVILMVGISGLGWSIIEKIMLKYLTDALDLHGTDYIIAAVSLILTIFIFLYFWRRSIQKRGKMRTLLYVFVLGAIFLPISLLGLIPLDNYLVVGIIFIVGIGCVLGAWYLFPYIVYADVAEDDEKLTGELKAGIYSGFPSIILNIFQAVGAFLVGAILTLPDISPSTFSYSMGLIFFGPMVSVILLISYFYTKKFVKLDYDWEKK